MQLGLVELSTRLFLRAHRRLTLLNLVVDLLLDLERQRRLLILELLPFLAQLQLHVPKRGHLRFSVRKRRGMHLALFLEQPLERLRLPLCRSRPFAGQLLRTLLDFGALGVAHGRDRIRACLLQALQRSPRKSLLQGKFMRTARTGDVDVQGQEQSIGAQRRLR